MVHYKLKPKQNFLEKARNFDMIAEGGAIFGILTDGYRFPETKESIEEYRILVPEQMIEFKLKTKLDKNIHEYFSKYWEIEEI
jgi:hypothetical protein